MSNPEISMPMTKPDLVAYKPFALAAEATPPVPGATELRGVLAMQALSRKDAVESNSPKRIPLSTEMVAYSWEKAIGKNIDQDAAAERRMQYKVRPASGKTSVKDRMAELRAMGITQDQQMSTPGETVAQVQAREQEPFKWKESSPERSSGPAAEAKFLAEYLEAVKPEDIKFVFVAGETRKRLVAAEPLLGAAGEIKAAEQQPRKVVHTAEQTQASGDVLAVLNVGEKLRLSSESLPGSGGVISQVLSAPESRRVVTEGVAQSQGEVQRVDASPKVRVFTAEALPEVAGIIHSTFRPSKLRTIVGEGLAETTGTIKDFSLPAASSNVVRSAPLENRGEVNPKLQTSGANVIESAPIVERTEDGIDVRFGDPRKQKVESGLSTRDKDGEILSVSHDRVSQKVVAGESLAAEPQRDLIPHFAPPRTRRVTTAPVRVMEPVQIAKSTEKDEDEVKEKSEKVVAQMPEEPGEIQYVQNLSGNTVTAEEVDDVAPGEIRAVPVKDRYARIAARAVLPRRTDDGLELPPLGRSEKTQTVTGKGLIEKQSIVFPQMQPPRGSRRVTSKSVL